MEREQIIKALEICTDDKTESCEGCPFIEIGACHRSSMLKLALSLIKELTEEVDCLKDNNEHLAVFLTETKADTVRKMKERLKDVFCSDSENIRNTDGYIRYVIEKTAKEMLEESCDE